MQCWFTSRDEWQELRSAGRWAYLRAAVGHTFQSGLLGCLFLIVVCGQIEPHWRSAGVLAIMATSLVGGCIAAYLLFSREWRAAKRTYGVRP